MINETATAYADGFTAAYAALAPSTLFRTATQKAAYDEGYRDGETYRPTGRKRETQ